jgi:hypothetical protein
MESALAALDKELEVPTEDDLLVGGWFTAMQMAPRKKVTRCAMDKRLRRKVDMGKAEMKSVTVKYNGAARKITFFRLK